MNCRKICAQNARWNYREDTYISIYSTLTLLLGLKFGWWWRTEWDNFYQILAQKHNCIQIFAQNVRWNYRENISLYIHLTFWAKICILLCFWAKVWMMVKDRMGQFISNFSPKTVYKFWAKICILLCFWAKVCMMVKKIYLYTFTWHFGLKFVYCCVFGLKFGWW